MENEELVVVEEYNEEEVEIGESVELLKQIPRKKGKNCILCGSNAIVQVLAVWLISSLKMKKSVD